MPRDKRLPLAKCMDMTLKQIRNSIEYKGLTPLGKSNRSGSYRYGNKSYLRKDQLCRVLDNPSSYHNRVKVAKKSKKNMGPRKRVTRKGACLVAARKLPCNGRVYKHRGLTTTGEACCYKNKQSKKVMDKRSKTGHNVVAKRPAKKAAKKVSKKKVLSLIQLKKDVKRLVKAGPKGMTWKMVKDALKKKHGKNVKDSLRQHRQALKMYARKTALKKQKKSKKKKVKKSKKVKRKRMTRAEEDEADDIFSGLDLE